MKKILVALTLIALLFTACTKETKTPVTVTVNLSKTTATKSGLASSHSHMTITVSNTTDNEATIQWERTEATPVTGWTYNVNGSSTTSGTLDIPANGSVDVVLMVMPNNYVGVGAGMLKFYDSENQTLSMKTFSYTLTTFAQLFEVITISPTTQTIRTNDPNTDYKMKVYNPTNADININWNSTVGANNPSSWIVNVCDPASCYPPDVINGVFPVPAGDSVSFKLSINHALTMGNGTATANFYIATDSIATLTSQTVNHTVQ